MKKPIVTFNPGDRVFAKVKGYPAWPARVTGPADAKCLRYHVFFYGTYETAIVKREEMWLFNEATKAKYGVQKRKGFTEALFEIESDPDIMSQEQMGPPPAAAPPTPSAEATPVKRPGKRKAEAVPTPPPAKQAKKATPKSTPNEEKTSRSGRVIKPKTFSDDKEEALMPIKPAEDTKKKPEPRKMWVQVKATSDMVEIDLDRDKPASFDSTKAELEWERETAKNALKFKHMVESGQFIPEEIRKKLAAKTNRTPQEEEILRNAKVLAACKGKVELGLIDLDNALKMALHFKNPDMQRCLDLLEELHALSVTPLMLKKQPDIVTTVRKMRKYVGPQTAHPDPKMNELWESLIQKIRLKANAVFSTFQSSFAVTEGMAFSKYFSEQVDRFKKATKDFEKEKLLRLITDPTA